MIQSIINCKNPDEADFILLPANYDKTSSGGKGADKGPEAITQFLDTQIEIYGNNRVACLPHRDLNTLSPEEAIAIIREQFEEQYKKGKFIITLGGDHSISNGPFEALAALENPKEITLLHIDAHFDLRESDADYNETPWGRLAHCSVLRRASEFGFPIVSVGVRSYSQEELAYAKDHITFFRWDRFGGERPTPQTILNHISTKAIYVTIDIDGIDPAHMPSTGTPVQGGLSWDYTMVLLEAAFREKGVVSADITEVAPQSFSLEHPETMQPHDRLTVLGAAQLAYTMILGKARKRDLSN